MKQFAALFADLDATTSTTAKVASLKAYFAQAQPADAAWAVYFLAGGNIPINLSISAIAVPVAFALPELAASAPRKRI